MAATEPRFFGIGCTSLNAASSLYLKYLKCNGFPLPAAAYVGSSSSFKKSDKNRLLFVDGVSTLFQILPVLGEKDRVLVSDSPILLGEIPNTPILDIEQNVNRLWSFAVKKFDARRFHQALVRSYRSPAPMSDLKWDRVEQLGLLVESMTSGVIATPYLNLLAQLPPTKRNLVRKKMSEWLTAKIKASELVTFVTSAISPIGPVSRVILKDFSNAATKHEATILKGVALLKANRSVKTLLHNSEITAFELKFLLKIANSLEE